jgi:hypothetical protein
MSLAGDSTLSPYPANLGPKPVLDLSAGGLGVAFGHELGQVAPFEH